MSCCCGNELSAPLDPLEAEEAFLRDFWAERNTSSVAGTISDLITNYLDSIGGDERAALMIVAQYERENNPPGIVSMYSLCMAFYVDAITLGLGQTAKRWLQTATEIQQSKLFFIAP